MGCREERKQEDQLGVAAAVQGRGERTLGKETVGEFQVSFVHSIERACKPQYGSECIQRIKE